jgi:hypothetical protein
VQNVVVSSLHWFISRWMMSNKRSAEEMSYTPKKSKVLKSVTPPKLKKYSPEETRILLECMKKNMKPSDIAASKLPIRSVESVERKIKKLIKKYPQYTSQSQEGSTNTNVNPEQGGIVINQNSSY